MTAVRLKAYHADLVSVASVCMASPSVRDEKCTIFRTNLRYFRRIRGRTLNHLEAFCSAYVDWSRERYRDMPWFVEESSVIRLWKKN